MYNTIWNWKSSFDWNVTNYRKSDSKFRPTRCAGFFSCAFSLLNFVIVEWIKGIYEHCMDGALCCSCVLLVAWFPSILPLAWFPCISPLTWFSSVSSWNWSHLFPYHCYWLLIYENDTHTDTETQSQSHSNTVLNEYCTSNCNTHTLHTSNLFDKPFILVLFFLLSFSCACLFLSSFLFFFWPNTFAPLLLYFIGNIHFTHTHARTIIPKI